MQIKGKVVIVTGASGGIGLATAKLLGSKGARVVLAARNEQALLAAAAEIPDSLAVRADLRKAEDISALVERTLALFGRVDCLVNNAGQDFNAAVEEIDPDDFRSILELNLIGALEAMQAVIPIMRSQGSGSIVNVSSGTTKMILTGSAGYSSSKAALNHLSLIAREELAPDGIAVSVIYPYITDTDLERNAIGGDPDWDGTLSPGIPPADPPEKVAEAILSLIESGEAEAEPGAATRLGWSANPKGGVMPDIDATLKGARDAMTVSRVFGEPIERGEVTVIPVAQIQGGGGGGHNREHNGAAASVSGRGRWAFS